MTKELGFVTSDQFEAMLDGLQRLYDQGVRQLTVQILPDSKEYFDSRGFEFADTTSSYGQVLLVMTKTLESDPARPSAFVHEMQDGPRVRDSIGSWRYGQPAERELLGKVKGGDVSTSHEVIGSQGDGPRSSGYRA
jgi:hypothetical protein